VKPDAGVPTQVQHPTLPKDNGSLPSLSRGKGKTSSQVRGQPSEN